MYGPFDIQEVVDFVSHLALLEAFGNCLLVGKHARNDRVYLKTQDKTDGFESGLAGINANYDSTGISIRISLRLRKRQTEIRREPGGGPEDH